MTADPQWISVGRIRGSHGVQGALKIEPYSAATESVLCRIHRWRLVEPAVGEADTAMLAGKPDRLATGTPEAPGVVDGSGPEASRSTVVQAARRSVPAPSRPLALPMQVRCRRCRVQGDMLVVEPQWLEGMPPLSREQVMALKGVEIQVDRADFPAPDEDEFYHADLIGCEVIGQDGQVLGRVVALDDHGAQQVLRLADDLLIPFVREIVRDVDLKARQIHVDWAADWR